MKLASQKVMRQVSQRLSEGERDRSS